MPVTPRLLCLIGSPGSGKGTQGARLAAHLGGQHLSIGEMIRNQVAAGVKVPRERGARLASSQWTCDQLVAAVDEASPWLLVDGFPRSPQQVDALMGLSWRCAGVLCLDVPFSEALQRMRLRGREGENVAQIAYRHSMYLADSARTRAALADNRIEIYDIDSSGDVDHVQALCRLAVAPLSG